MTEIRDAPRELRAYVLAVRADWQSDDVRDALIACHDAGWPWKRIHEEMTRVLLAEDSSPDDLLHAAGKTRQPRAGRGLTAEERDELRSNFLAACDEATGRFTAQRRTGPLPELPPGRDP